VTGVTFGFTPLTPDSLSGVFYFLGGTRNPRSATALRISEAVAILINSPRLKASFAKTPCLPLPVLVSSIEINGCGGVRTHNPGGVKSPGLPVSLRAHNWAQDCSGCTARQLQTARCFSKWLILYFRCRSVSSVYARRLSNHQAFLI